MRCNFMAFFIKKWAKNRAKNGVGKSTKNFWKRLFEVRGGPGEVRILVTEPETIFRGFFGIRPPFKKIISKKIIDFCYYKKVCILFTIYRESQKVSQKYRFFTKNWFSSGPVPGPPFFWGRLFIPGAKIDIFLGVRKNFFCKNHVFLKKRPFFGVLFLSKKGHFRSQSRRTIFGIFTFWGYKF